MEELKGLKPISVKDLLEMGPEKYSEITTVCWKYDILRYDIKGLFDMSIKDVGNHCYNLSWSNIYGDPDVYHVHIDEILVKKGDYKWKYGLFINEDEQKLP